MPTIGRVNCLSARWRTGAPDACMHSARRRSAWNPLAWIFGRAPSCTLWARPGARCPMQEVYRRPDPPVTWGAPVRFWERG